MTISKIKKLLRKKLDHLPEKNQNQIKTKLYEFSKIFPDKFNYLVERLARKKQEKDISDEKYKLFTQSPEYNEKYTWSRTSPRKN